MRLRVLGVAIIATVANATAAPRVRRDAIVGCWDAGRGATLTVARDGKHDVRVVARFADTPRGGPQRLSELAVWVAATGELEASCRPRSIHGSFCRIRPEPGGGLRIRVYAKGHGTGRRGRLVEDFVAVRCTRR